MKQRKPKKSLPMDERAVRSLAALTQGVPDFDAGLAAIIENLKPRIRTQWSRLREDKSTAEARQHLRTVLSAWGVADPDQAIKELQGQTLDVGKIVEALNQVVEQPQKEGS